MLILSLLFFAVLMLLVFSLTKDTGRNTKHARRSKEQYLTTTKPQEGAQRIHAAKVVKVS